MADAPGVRPTRQLAPHVPGLCRHLVPSGSDPFALLIRRAKGSRLSADQSPSSRGVPCSEVRAHETLSPRFVVSQAL